MGGEVGSGQCPLFGVGYGPSGGGGPPSRGSVGGGPPPLCCHGTDGHGFLGSTARHCREAIMAWGGPGGPLLGTRLDDIMGKTLSLKVKKLGRSYTHTHPSVWSSSSLPENDAPCAGCVCRARGSMGPGSHCCRWAKQRAVHMLSAPRFLPSSKVQCTGSLYDMVQLCVLRPPLFSAGERVAICYGSSAMFHGLVRLILIPRRAPPLRFSVNARYWAATRSITLQI